jgi:methionyl-tRNA synthetase
MPQTYFLTTAIDYVNGLPHLGHAYEKVLADVIARYHRSLGHEVFFLTGTDEHGQKVQQSAVKAGKTPIEFCDETSAQFRALCDSLEVTYSRFVRTTEEEHKEKVRAYLQQLKEKDEIYFQEHEGFYSQRAEQFVTEKDMVDGKWPEIFGEVLPMKEPNYFFKLSKYQDWLVRHIEDHPDFIFPDFRRKELLEALKKPINDLCISRPKSRLEWGIPLPFDEDYVTYVWFDALLNYNTFADFNGKAYWPADAHVIGKDIMIPAHAVYWPIMLRALDLPLPKRLIVHGWWLNRGAKMSKSTGNSVDPLPYLEKFGPDPFRYFVMREMVLGQDADFSDEKLEQRYKDDLGNDLGNLVNRSISMLNRYRGGVVPSYAAKDATAADADLRSDQVITDYKAAMDALQPQVALQVIWKLVARANEYVEESAPWKLAKEPAQAQRLDVVLAHLIESVRRLAVLIEPVLPVSAQKIQAQLGLAAPQKHLVDAAFGATLAGHKVNAPEPLFPRFEPEKA